MRHFKPFLYGKKYILRTDHKPLIYLITMKHVDAKLLQTLEDLQVGKYSIEYLPGRCNVVADTLSRMVDFTECIDDENHTYIVKKSDEYIVVPGGPNAMFQCLSQGLYGNLDEHITIRQNAMDRIIKDAKRYKIVDNKQSRRKLLAMRGTDVLPCWQALLAFAEVYAITVNVHQDGLGMVSFPAASAKFVIHLHSLGGVHFNYLGKESNITTSVNCVKSSTHCSDKVLYVLQDESDTDYTRVLKCRNVVVTSVPEPTETGAKLTQRQMVALQQAEREITLLKTWVQKKVPAEEVKLRANEVGKYGKLINSYDKLTIEREILCYEKKLVIPITASRELAVKFHRAAGHMGRDKTLMAMKEYYFSCNLTEAVTEAVRECLVCQEFKGVSRGGEPLCKRKATTVLQQYALDLLELDAVAGNIKYLLVGVDLYSRFIHAIPIKDKKAITVCSALEQRILPNLMKVPEIIITDNGPEFRATVFEELLSKYSITHFTSIPYLPQTNGAIERVNQTLLNMLAPVCTERGTTWLEELPRILMLYNHSVHSQTGKAPADFFVNEKVKLPLPSSEVWKEATNKFKPYLPGEEVGHKLPAHTRHSKLSKRYEGSCIVTATDPKGLTYEIKCPTDKGCKKVHYKQLKKWYGNSKLSPDVKEEACSKKYTFKAAPIMSVEEQLRNQLHLKDIFKHADSNLLRSRPQGNLTSNLPEVGSHGGEQEEPQRVATATASSTSLWPLVLGPSAASRQDQDAAAHQGQAPNLAEHTQHELNNSAELNDLLATSPVADNYFSGFGEVAQTSTPRSNTVRAFSFTGFEALDRESEGRGAINNLIRVIKNFEQNQEPEESEVSSSMGAICGCKECQRTEENDNSDQCSCAECNP